jgi:hypothetical protein
MRLLGLTAEMLLPCVQAGVQVRGDAAALCVTLAPLPGCAGRCAAPLASAVGLRTASPLALPALRASAGRRAAAGSAVSNAALSHQDEALLALWFAVCGAAPSHREKAWLAHFADLEAYAAAHDGRTDVPRESPNKLGRWVAHQRMLYTRGTLPARYLQMLQLLKFDFEPQTTQWAENYAALEAYAAAHGGRTDVPRPDHPQLCRWVSTQRQEYAAGNLTGERKELLEQLGFTWDPNGTLWAKRYEQAKAHAAAHGGSTELPHDWAVCPELPDWLKLQRRLLVRGELSRPRAAKLAALSYAWSDSDAAFAHGLQQLAAYAAAHGGSMVVPAPADGAGWPGAAPLREWLHLQRLRKKHGTLSSKRVRQLEQLGLIWDEDDAIWQDRFSQLEAYAAAHDGDTQVLRRFPGLGLWVKRQREMGANGTLPAARRAKLDALRFAWTCT